MEHPVSILYDLAFWIDGMRLRNSRPGDFYRFVRYHDRVPHDVDLVFDATHVLMKPRYNPDRKVKRLKILCFLLTAYMYYLRFPGISKSVFGRPLPGMPQLTYREAFVSAVLPAIPHRIYVLVNGKPRVDRSTGLFEQNYLLVRCPFCMGLHEHGDWVGWHTSLCTYTQNHHVPNSLENYNTNYFVRRNGLKFKEHEYIVTHFLLSQIFRALRVSDVLRKIRVPYEIAGLIEDCLFIRWPVMWNTLYPAPP